MKYQNPSTCKDTNWLKFCFQNQSAKTQMLGIILNFDFLKGLVFKNVASDTGDKPISNGGAEKGPN